MKANGRKDLLSNFVKSSATRRFRPGKKFPGEVSGSLWGTGVHGALPLMNEVLAEAKRRGIEVIAAPTLEACQLLEEVKKERPCLSYPAFHVLSGSWQIDAASIYSPMCCHSVGCGTGAKRGQQRNRLRRASQPLTSRCGSRLR